MKTDQEIKQEVYDYIKGSVLEEAVNGVLTKRKRPLNSKKEDIVISVLANVNAQRQEAFVNVNRTSRRTSSTRRTANVLPNSNVCRRIS